MKAAIQGQPGDPRGASRRWKLISIVGWFAVVFYVAALLLTILGKPIGMLDEATPLVTARMVSHGKTPATDFWIYYPPGYLYLLSGGLKLFGDTVVVPRIFAGCLSCLFLAVAARFFRTEFPRFGALTSWVILLLVVSLSADSNFQFWPALYLGAISLMLYLSARHADGARRDRLTAAAGLVTGFSLLMRVNFALYVAAVVLLDVVFRDEIASGPVSKGRNRIRRLIFFAVPIVFSNLVFYGLVFGKDTRIVFDQSVTIMHSLMRSFGFELFSLRVGLFAVSWPMLWLALTTLGDEGVSSAVFVPLAMAAVVAGSAMTLRTNPSIAVLIPALNIALIAIFHRFVRRIGVPEFCLLAFYSCLLHYYLTRADPYHRAPLLVCAAILLPFLIFSRPVHSVRKSVSQGRAFALLLAAICFVAAIPGEKPNVASIRTGTARLTTLLSRPGLSDGQRLLASGSSGPWAGIPRNPDEVAVLRFLQTTTSPSEPIYVGVTDHSRGVINSASLLWLSDKPVVLYHPVLDPSMLDAPGQSKMIADLNAQKIRYAVLDTGPPAGVETGYVGSSLLDNYLASHYSKIAQFGKLAVFRRTD